MAGLNNLTRTIPNCEDGNVNYEPVYVKAVAGCTCVLSILGTVLIFITYLCFKNLRNKPRELVLHLSLMDFTVACANLIGIFVDYNKLLYPEAGSPNSNYDIDNGFCIAQASFAMYGTLGSILWTNALAVYFYMRVVVNNSKLCDHIVFSFYVICYGLPLVMTVWFASTGRLGYDPLYGSGWCTLVLDSNDPESSFVLLMGNSMWIYVTLILIPSVSISLICFINLEIHGNKIGPSKELVTVFRHMENKLLAIPIVFVLLRIWSLVITELSVDGSLNIPCEVIMILLVVAGIGDSGQGFFNAIIYCLWTKKVRKAYLNAVNLKRLLGKKSSPLVLNESLNHPC